MPAPRPYAASSTTKPDVFERQFRIDTGETERTRRAESTKVRTLRAQAKDRVTLKFDLAQWPDELRDVAHVWIAIGAPSKITTEGALGVTVTQNGIGMATHLDYTFDVDGTMILGTDHLAKNGEVTVELDSGGRTYAVDVTLHVVVYIPKDPDPIHRAADR